MFRSIIIYWHIFNSSSFHHICNIKCRLDCRYSLQNIFNVNPHRKPISLLTVPICTHDMLRTWWPEAGTIIVTGPYYPGLIKGLIMVGREVWQKHQVIFLSGAGMSWLCMINQLCIEHINNKISWRSPQSQVMSLTCLHYEVTHFSLVTGVVALHIQS